ncbi:MAG: ABC transporter ATP-binding protein, partial [Thermosipho sp. (in: Bacteria)]|nr:ABC transporter ATP-binding protein [Thermosipho sp. (in: thermotogales)]
MEEKKSVKRFLKVLFKRYWRRQVVTSILVIIESGGGILIPLVFKQIIDKAIPSGDYKILLNYILGLMGLLLLATIFSYLGEVWFEF